MMRGDGSRLSHRLIGAGCLSLLCLCSSPPRAFAQAELARPAAAAVVEIEVLDGPLRVTGDADSVEVHTVVTDSGTVMERTGSVVRITNLVRNRPAELIDVRVPRTATVRVKVGRRGPVHIDGVEGRLEVSSVGGTVTLSGRPASLILDSTDGSVVLELAGLDVQGPHSVAVLNGDLTIHFAPGAGAMLETRIYNGKLFSELPLDTARVAVPGAVEKRMRISVMGGGPSMQVSVFNGDLRLEDDAQ